MKITLAALILAISASLALAVESKPAKANNPQQASSAEKVNPSGQVFPVHLTVTQENHPPSLECCKEKGAESDAEWWTAKGTIALAILTLVLALIAGGQLVMFRSQLRLMRDGVQDAKDMAAAAKSSAEATKNSSDLAREEFLATHRPRIRLRFVWPEGALEPKGKIGAVAQVTNVGVAEARFVDHSIKLLVTESARQLPGKPAYAIPVTESTILASGMSFDIRLWQNLQEDVSDADNTKRSNRWSCKTGKCQSNR